MPQVLGTAMVFKAIIGTMLNLALSKLLSKKKKNTDDLKRQSGRMINVSSSKEPIPVIYGKDRIPINRCYAGSTGTNREYIHIIGIIGEGPIEGIDNIDGVDQLFLDDKIYTEYGAGNVYYEIFTGTSTQNVCATLNTAIPEWTDPLRYTAYLYIRLKWDPDKFQSLPNITLRVKGLKVYNPDTDVTEYSNNAALAVRDYLTRSSRRGGFGIPSARINDTSVETARSYCATKGWTCNLSLNDNDQVIDNLSTLLVNFRGEVIYSTLQFKIAFRDLNYETTVMSFDDDTLFSTGKAPVKLKEADIFNVPNTVNITYNSEIGNTDGTSTYQERAYTFSDLSIVTKDGIVIPETISCKGLSDLDLIQKMANYFYERLRRNKTYTFSSGSRGFSLEPCDLINLTYSGFGWVDKVSRVLSVGLNPKNLTVNITCIEEDSDFYDDTYDPATLDTYDTTLPNILNYPNSVINVSHSEEVYYYRDRSFTRWIISFDRPDPADDPFFKHAKLFLKIGTGDYSYRTISDNGHIVDPVEEGVTYYLKMVSENIFGVTQQDADATIISKTILGKTTLPTDLTYMIATTAGDTVNIFCNVLSDPDISIYEVRLNSWVGGIFFASNESPNFSRAGVKPGSYNLYCKAKDNNGQYASNFVSAAVTVYYPAGYTDKNTWSWDFSTGTFNNTEQDTYSGSDVLKCSHTSDVLVGTWISPEYDLGSIKTVRIWGDFLTVFLATSNTWGGIFSASTTWGDISSGAAWYELAPADIAGVLTAKLEFGDTSGSYPSEIEGFEILAPEITARYVRVTVTLTDPNLDANTLLKELNMKAAYWS